jgi:hypothetical protein
MRLRLVRVLVVPALACTSHHVSQGPNPERAVVVGSCRGQQIATFHDPEKANTHYWLAVKRDRGQSPPDSVALIGDLVGYSQALHEVREITGADSIGHEALEIAMGTRGELSPQTAWALTVLADYAWQENRLLTAESLATRAQAIDSTLKTVDDESMLARTVLGRALGLQLRYAQGDSAFQRALDVWREHCDTLAPAFAGALTSYAEFLWWRGTSWYDRADSVVDRARDILAAGQLDSGVVAFNMKVRAELRHERHDDRNADSLAFGAFAIAVRIFGVHSARVADYARMASVTRYARGDSVTAAQLYALSKGLALPGQ